MGPHIKNYLKHFDLGEQDVWQCEACGKQLRINNGLEIHHIIFRSHGGDNSVQNCICLCVGCHEMAHSSKNYVTPDEFQYIHNCFLVGKHQTFLK